jgi:SAM-dependent methyltransferase
MPNLHQSRATDSHSAGGSPSAWVLRFAEFPAGAGAVLDVAAGGGRHTRLFLERGHQVTAVDRDISKLTDLRGHPRAEVIEADLEDGGPFPLIGRSFAKIVIVNYLHRPLTAHLLNAISPGGMLIYETFAVGNERFGKPSNPDFLLHPGELLHLAAAGGLRVLAYEDLVVQEPRPAAVQRIAAVRPDPIS